MIWVLIYLVGCVVAYFDITRIMKRDLGCVERKKLVMGVSLFSWIIVVVNLLDNK